MELHLGLALPTTPFLPIGYELKQCPFDADVKDGNGSCSSVNGGKKRSCFDDETRVVPKTLPLFLWNNDHPNEEDDPNDPDDNSSSSYILKNEGEGLVGWPPVKAWRKKLRRHVHSGRVNNNRMVAATAAKISSTYVKVKIELDRNSFNSSLN
ncbi:uncharacterized protein LOC120176903 [Hibiscus syriacus]|uniref:uncharacterized protein LOC120176903 n=1 Tax=Hibiscus syriacus TaxID=106335 RepID=UPI001924AFC7|nr:uncharacterized protein LOC120176903 [Hibiscus syriacus]